METFGITSAEHHTAGKSIDDDDLAVFDDILIISLEEFFCQNPDILLYMCSTEGGKQAQRARLFLRWFNGAEQQKHYVARSVEVRGEEGRTEYVALIVQRSNPQLEEILAVFDEEAAMFNDLKP